MSSRSLSDIQTRAEGYANVLSCLKSDPSYEFIAIGEVILKINIV
jgi:hypothetical protein